MNPLGYSLFTHCLFDATKNKLDYCRGKDCIENFSEDIKKHAIKIENCKKKRNDTVN